VLEGSRHFLRFVYVPLWMEQINDCVCE
jgi:hypothetical protein